MPTFEFARFDDANPVGRKREELEGLQAQPDVLDRRHVEPAERSNRSSVWSSVASIGPWKNGERVDDDQVERLLGDLDQPGQLRLGDELGVLGPDRRRQDVEARGVPEM